MLCPMVTMEGGFAKLVMLGYGSVLEFADPSMEELVPYNVDASLVNVGLSKEALDRIEGASGWGMWVCWNARTEAVDPPGESMEPCIKEEGGCACEGEGIFEDLKGQIAVFGCIMGWAGQDVSHCFIGGVAGWASVKG